MAGTAGLASLTSVGAASLAHALGAPPPPSSANLATDEVLGSLELVAEFPGPMPTGVTDPTDRLWMVDSWPTVPCVRKM